MNKLNPIFEAICEIDDNIVSEAVTAKKLPLNKKILITAAAAALAALMVGFAFFGLDVTYELLPQEGMRLPNYEEMTEWGAVELGDYSQGVSGVPSAGYHYYFTKNTVPSDLFEKFNVHPLLNENFAEEPTDVYANASLCDTAENLYADEISFTYKLIDKETGVPVEFIINCAYETYNGQNMTVSFQDARETVVLNDGSKAYISDYEWGGGIQSNALFYYGGIYYSVTADIDSGAIKGVLNRLGVL